jgi:hypothetical protein
VREKNRQNTSDATLKKHYGIFPTDYKQCYWFSILDHLLRLGYQHDHSVCHIVDRLKLLRTLIKF